MSCNTLCYKFVVASVLSVGTTAFASVMLILDKFQNTAVSTFCTSLITFNLAFWMDSPKQTEKNRNKDHKSENSVEI